MTATSFTAARAAFEDWSDWLADPDPQDNRLFLGRGFEHVHVAPQSVTLLGGMPGAGKTALAGQWAISAMEADPTLTTLIANVEMPPRELLNRQLARLSRITLTEIRERRFDAGNLAQRDAGLDRLEPLCERLTFLEAPFTMPNVVETANETQARLIVVDYAQRFGALDDSPDRCQTINSVMDTLRLMANRGAAVIVLSSLSRSRDVSLRRAVRLAAGLRPTASIVLGRWRKCECSSHSSRASPPGGSAARFGQSHDVQRCVARRTGRRGTHRAHHQRCTRPQLGLARD